MYYVGIDGGGTKSRLMAVDESGKEYGPFIGGSTNISSNSPEVVQANIRELFARFLGDTPLSAVKAFCIGSAGVDMPKNILVLGKLIDDIGIICPTQVVNDVEIALESVVRGKPGLVIVCGTGSIALGKNERGETHRTGGWGHLVGDEGSGYWVGKEAIRRSLYSLDQRSEPTVLSDLLVEHYKLSNMAEILPYVYSQNINKSEIAWLARLVDTAAEQNDRAAIAILEEAAGALYGMAANIAKRLELDGDYPIILSGGLVRGSKPLRERLNPQLMHLSPHILETTAEPCAGALYLAQKLVE